GRVKVAIGENDLSGGQRRPDDVAGVLRTRRREEQRLRVGCQIDLTCVQQHVADALGERSSTGLAREEDIAAARAERLRETSGLNGFSGGLAALEREEHAAHRYI